MATSSSVTATAMFEAISTSSSGAGSGTIIIPTIATTSAGQRQVGVPHQQRANVARPQQRHRLRRPFRRHVPDINRARGRGQAQRWWPRRTSRPGCRAANPRSAARLTRLRAWSDENEPGPTSCSQPQRVCDVSPVNSTGPCGVRAT